MRIISLLIASAFSFHPFSGSFSNGFLHPVSLINDGARCDSLKSKYNQRFLRVRYEVLPRSKAVGAFPTYVKKYKKKFLNASPFQIDFFTCHKKFFKGLHNNESEQVTTLAMVGDIMWVGKAAPNYVSKGVLNYLDKFDLVIGNLESPIDSTRRVPKFLPDYLKYNSNKHLVGAFKSPTRGGNLFSALSFYRL